jgi:hypothetical protein
LQSKKVNQMPKPKSKQTRKHKPRRWRDRQKKDRPIEIEFVDNPHLTSWGGLALAERLACRTRLWSTCRKLLPQRTRTRGGYHTTTVVAALMHGLLSGAQGTWAAEALREDAAACKAAGFGVSSVPEEATIWRTLGQMDAADGQAALGQVTRRQVRRLIQSTPRPQLIVEGFLPVFVDGTWIEVGEQTQYEGTKFFDGERKLMWSVLWTGPYVAGTGFAAAGEDERAASMRLVEPVWREVIRPTKLADATLWLLDSLYGDEDCLKQLEACEGSHYIVGANKLTGVEAAAMEQPEQVWVQTTPRRRGELSQLCVHRYQGELWERARTVVTRRWRQPDEMFWHYRSVLTDLEPEEERLARLMRREGLRFAEVVWGLYDHKQAMENQFKDLLRDLGLHNPPCRQLGRNGIFYAIAALALNLTVGVRRIGMRGRAARMSLARLRRMLLALPGRVAQHARRTKVRLYSTSNRLKELFAGAFGRLAAC